MTIRLRTAFIIFLGVLVICFLYIERSILSPFIFAAVFAYIFNPIVDFASEKLKLPRTLSILTIYVLLIGIFIIGSFLLSARIIEESSDLRSYANTLLINAHGQLQALPDWLRPTAYDVLINLRRSRFIAFFEAPSFLPFFSQAVSRVVGFFIFLFSGYYFLKDGKETLGKLVSYVPRNYQRDFENLLKKIADVLGGYLRGQVFLIFLMSVVSYIALAVLGIRFAVIIALFSGFAEIIPVIGPIVAGGVAALVALVTGTANFGLTPVNATLIVIAIYFILRQLEDYFVIPYVMGKITKLPPFMIFFAVIAGGHIAGVLGLILAVPVTAILRLSLEFAFERIKSTKR